MITINAQQEPAGAAVVIPTIIRDTLPRAVRSVFRQKFDGRIHLLVGVDVAKGPRAVIDMLAAECPSNIMMTVMDFGYSTSARHGGLYSNHFSGALRTILTYAANSRYVSYLDDNDWYGRDHLAGLRAAMVDSPWAFSYRWLVHPDAGRPICRDEWDSVGPGRGINQGYYGGFVQPSCMMVDKFVCHDVVPLWAAAFPDGTGEDRLIFHSLASRFKWAASEKYSCYCILGREALRHAHNIDEFARRGLRWVNDPALAEEAENHVRQAIAAAEQGNTDEALNACRSALSINPHHAEALYRLGLIAHSRVSYAEALIHLSDAIAIDDTNDAYFAALEQVQADSGGSEGRHPA